MNSAAVSEANGAYSAAVLNRQATQAIDNAARADRDADVAGENADRASLAGQERAMDQDLEAMSQMDQIRAAQGASGLRGGSHVDTLRTLDRLAARDRQRIAAAGQAEAGNFRTQENAFQMEAADLRSGAGALRADAQMTKSNARSQASAQRVGGVAGFVSGIAAGGDTLLGGMRDPGTRDAFSKTWKRFRGR